MGSCVARSYYVRSPMVALNQRIKMDGFSGSGFLTQTRLGAPRRRSGDRILGPWMLGVAPAHLRAHGGVAAAPKSRQIAGHLHRTVRGREQLDQERHFAAGNGRMAVEAEQFLDADRNLRSAFGLVIDRDLRAGRRRKMGRRLGIEPVL